MPQLTLRYRVSVASRIFAAIVGGYMLTAQAVATLAVYLPMAPAEATLTATILSFAIYAGVVVWTFATQSVRRVWQYMAVAMIVLLTLSWVHDAVSPG